MSDLFLQIEKLHPSEEKQVFLDPEFEEEQREMEEAAKGVLWDDTQVLDYGEAPAPQPVHSPGEWEEFDIRHWMTE